MKSPKRNTKPAKKHRVLKSLLVVVAVIVVVAGGVLFYQQQQAKKAFANEISEARQLVLYNPLVTSGAAKKLQEQLPGTGDKTTDAQLEKQLNRKDFESLLKQAKTQMAKQNSDELAKQETLATKTEKKLNGLKTKSDFPSDSKKDVETLIDMSHAYFENHDAVGLNVATAGMQSLAGETATLIQKKTAKADKLAKAIQNDTYPSLGAYRADLPYHAGVILIDMEPGGPADNAGLTTVQDGGWEDSNVITGINQFPIQSAIIGNNSMQNVMQQLPLNSKATIKMKDGSTHEARLDMTTQQAENSTHHQELLPALDYGDGDGDTEFGVSGYQYSSKSNDKEIGYEVTDIDANSPAADSGLKPGDVICLIDDYGVGSQSSLDKTLSQYDDGDTVTVGYVTSDGHLKTTDVTLSDYDD